jgi:two-component system catabolic regulation response regulator CreB
LKHAGDILIVEDESAIADTIAYALKTEGFTPRRCERGEEALALLRGGGIRFVILDLGLPDLSGFEVLRRLRTFSQVPVRSRRHHDGHPEAGLVWPFAQT